MATAPVQEAHEKDANHIDGLSAGEWDDLCKLRDELKVCQDEEADAKERHSTAKKATDAAQSKLNRFIDEVRSPSLWNQPRADDAEETTDNTPDWRSVSLDDLELPAGIQEKLVSNDPPLDCLGAIIDWTDEKPLTSVAGIGATKAEKIDELIHDYLREHRLECVVLARNDDESDPEPDTEDAADECDPDGEEMEQLQEEGL